MPKLKALRRDADKALQAISDHLEGEATKALWALAKKHPNVPVQFCSAMGTWTMDVNGKDFEPRRLFNLFARIEGDYGFNAIPAPIFLRIHKGKLERLTDWGANPWKEKN